MEVADTKTGAFVLTANLQKYALIEESWWAANVLTAPPVVVMLYNCTLCGRPQAKDRKVCSSCYKAGRSLRGGHCPDCGVAHGVGNRTRVYCDDCREARLKERGKEYRARRKMDGIVRYRQMKQAETPLKGDKYAQYTNPISDEELEAKRAKFRALLAADVHVGSYGRPTHWRPPEAEHNGTWGPLAHSHMRGGDAGAGLDRVHNWNGNQQRLQRGERDSMRTKD